MSLTKKPVKELTVKEFIEAYNDMCARWTSATKNPPTINQVVAIALSKKQISGEKAQLIVKAYGKV